MKISILTKLLVVVMVLAIVPLGVLGFLSLSNISDMEDTSVDEVDTMTATAVENSKTALNDIGVSLVTQQAQGVARQVEIYLTQNPDKTMAELQGDTYLIFETPDDQAPIYAGIHYGTSDSTVLSLAGPLAIADGGLWNRFVDEDGNTIDLTGKFLLNASDGTAGFITSNTASTVTAQPAGPPGTTFDWDSGDPYFWSIAVNEQHSATIEGNGYTVLCDGATGVPRFHPSPMVVNLPDNVGRQMFPDIYKIMDESIESAEVSSGIFGFAETEGAEPKDRFSVFYPVKDANGNYVQTSDGATFMVSVAAYLEVFNAPVEAIEQQLIQNRDTVAADISDAKDNTQQMTWVVVAIMAIVVAIVSVVFGRSVVGPIKKLTNAADKVSKGDMDVKIDVTSKDEIGDLADSFGRMVSSMKFLMEDEEPVSSDGFSDEVKSALA